MDINDLFLSCKKGDLGRVQYLVEQKEVELNVRDKWDSTPLYYACLCGHEELVKYLLENGAKCEANTFDGERCLYGALNDRIKNLLKSYKAITAHMIRRDLYTEFLRRTHERGTYSDIIFEVHGHLFPAHRCILAARCSYFAEMFANKWKDRSKVIINNHLVQPRNFQAVLQYLYTARLDTQYEYVEEICRLAKQCNLDSLNDQLEERMRKVVNFESTKPGVNVTVISIEPNLNNQDLQNDFSVLADLALPTNFMTEVSNMELPFPAPENVQWFGDLIFDVEGNRFVCHKVFFCERSDYFKAMLEDHFGECSSEGDLPVLTLHDISTNVFLQILFYIYQDKCEELTETNVYDILCAADMFLLVGLKRHCASFIGQALDINNIVSVLQTARLFNLPRLEDQCAEFIASRIEQVLQLPEFSDFVREDAASVRERQETDSIPIIDDVRFHITNFIQTFSDMYDADQKLAQIDNFLEELGLDG